MPAQGDFGVTRTGGPVAWIIRRLTRSSVNHAFICIGSGQLVEADPVGVSLNVTDRYPKAVWSSVELTDNQRAAIDHYAIAHLGAQYNTVDILALGAALAFGWRAPAWVHRRLASNGRYICSQLVVDAYRAAGVDLAPGRDSVDVTPGDLLAVIEQRSEQVTELA